MTVFKFEIFVLLANITHLIMWVQYSVQWVGYGLDDQAIVVQFLEGKEIFLFSSRLQVGWPGSHGSIPGRERDFSLFQRVYTGSGTNPAYCPMGTVGHTSRDKATRECNYHSPQSSAEFKNKWRCISTSPCLHSVHRDNFNFNLLIMVPVLLTD